AVLLVANFVLGKVAMRNPRVDRLLRGQARILVNRGHVHADALRTENVSREELLQALRENGCASLADCRLAVLEVDGRISVILNKT
ncbi:MAG TPA: YetF domain-containing protein, partial [Vicinamibacteria bacterium]|nr:YetF domain-containing protein [Vicinamibacteria bacterium]